MTVAYWTVPTLLALVCLYAGGLKVLRSPDHLRPMMGWTDTLPLRLVRAIGGLEVIAALGLILPAPPGIAPALALVAATGLLAIQVGAISLLLRRGEGRLMGFGIVLFVLAGVAVNRCNITYARYAGSPTS
jgi:DoxX-like family